LATAVGTGPTTVTATSSTGSITGTAVLTVLPAVLVAITVSPLAGNVPAGETEQFSATGVYSDATTQNITDSVTWASTDTSAATVSNASGSQGVVTGVTTGASTITATDPSTSVEGVAAVTVLPAVLVAITVSPVDPSVALYGTQQFTATGLYSDASTENITDSVTWSSSDTGEASISNTPGSQGLATGLATGDVVITATDPSAPIAGLGALDVTGPAITLSPSSGPAKTKVVVDGQGFEPGETVAVHFRTGVSTGPRFTICTTVVSEDGTFTCKGRIRKASAAGALGLHRVNAKVPHVHGVIALTEFTLT
jgi:trimeric autotransporter adhesin